MSYANLDRVKTLLELTVPSLRTRDDYDSRIERLMGVAHEKVRLVIVKTNGGIMPPYYVLAVTTPTAATVAIGPLTEVSRRVRIRLVGADETALAATPLIATITGTVDSITDSETISFDRNGEFVSKTTWESLATPITFANIPGTPGTVEILEDVDPVLGDVEDMMTACGFLLEAADRFDKEAEPPEMGVFCRKATELLDDWVKVNLQESVLEPPLALRASS